MVKLVHSAELNQIAGALKIPAKAMSLDHRFRRWFFFGNLFHQKTGYLTILCTRHLVEALKRRKWAKWNIKRMIAQLVLSLYSLS